MAQTYEAFRDTIEARWLAGQRSGHVAAQRLYERVPFRLVDQPTTALAYLEKLVQETRDPEVQKWYVTVLGFSPPQATVFQSVVRRPWL